MGADQNSSKFESSTYIPKSPQALEPKSARIAMDKYLEAEDPSRNTKAKARETSQIAAQHTQTGLTGRAIQTLTDRSRPPV